MFNEKDKPLSITKKDPVIEDVVDTADTQVDDIAGLIATVHGEWTQANNARSLWIANQAKWYRQRYGVRPRPTFPWKNASNLHLPLVDKILRKMKAEYIASIWSSKPICSLTPANENVYDLATQTSYHLDWLLRSRMNAYPQAVRLADIMLQKGFSIAKVVYEKKYEPKTVIFSKADAKKKMREMLIDKGNLDIFENPAKVMQLASIIANNYGFDLEDKIDNKKVQEIVQMIYDGKDEIEFTIDALVYDAPKIVPLDPESVIVPGDTVAEFDLENAPWIIHRYQISIADMVENAKSGKWSRDTVDTILKAKGIHDIDSFNSAILNTESKSDLNRENEKNSKRIREGQGNATTDQVVFVHEVCMWYDSDGDGKPERHILEYAEDFQDSALRFIKYPYNMSMWPYAKIPFELTDGSHYSVRGIVEILNPLAAALNEQHNMKLNRQYLASTPLAFYNTDVVNKFDFAQIAPGKPVGVKGDPNNAIAWVNAPNADMSFQNEEGILRLWAEDISASTDQVSTNKSGTATEFKSNMTSRITVRQQDIELWNMAWREILKRCFALWLQYGPSVVSTPTSENNLKEDIVISSMGKAWEFNVNGRIGITDPVLEAQKALVRVQQFGPMTPHGKYVRQETLVKDYFEKDDYLLSKKLLYTPQEVAANDKAQAEAMAAQEKKEMDKQIMLAQAGAGGKGAKGVGSAPSARTNNSSQQLTGSQPQ